MNRTELKRAVRLIHRHRTLQPKVEELEESLTAYLISNQMYCATIGGFKISRLGGRLEIAELPRIDERQLDLIPDYFCLERR